MSSSSSSPAPFFRLFLHYPLYPNKIYAIHLFIFQSAAASDSLFICYINIDLARIEISVPAKGDAAVVENEIHSISPYARTKFVSRLFNLVSVARKKFQKGNKLSYLVGAPQPSRHSHPPNRVVAHHPVRTGEGALHTMSLPFYLKAVCASP